MGIRFYCPNGHRLHVKSFLAGKRGICPHCTARFRIPPESEIPRGSPKIRPDSQAAAAAASSPTPGKRRRAAASVQIVEEEGVGQPQSTVSPGLIGSAPQPQPDVPVADPIAEAPEAVWYVRPPSGGQYGPAKGDVMRQWLAEGRVSADSLVWREGWPDWVAAGPVFPVLNPTYTAAAIAPVKREAASLQLQPAPDETPAGSRGAALAARAVTHQKSLAPVILLVLTVLVLLVILVVVLTTRG